MDFAKIETKGGIAVQILLGDDFAENMFQREIASARHWSIVLQPYLPSECTLV